MSIGDSPTVWILGAGFSKSLGGPLLVDLFRQEYAVDLAKVMGRDLANDLTWVQALFNHGRDQERLWENAEEFLAYVDSAYGIDAAQDTRQRATLEGIYTRAEYPFRPSERSGRMLNDQAFGECLKGPLKAVRRALAAESSAFLLGLTDGDERWKPYRDWAGTLNPEMDSIITFNYDTVLETLNPDRFGVPLPGTTGVERDKVPVFKLHGSWNWVFDLTTGSVSINDQAITTNLPIAIAAPGRAKARSVEATFRPLWRDAREKLRHAYCVVILGYGFPKTDAEARMELLAGIEEAVGGQAKQIEIVLGPDIARPEARRVLELVRHRTGHRRVFVDREPELRGRNERITIITQHPLWAEDFIGDYGRRTTRTPPSF
jgi:hypothetical protein